MLYVYTCLIYVSIDRGIGVNKWVIDRGIDRSISWQVFLFICSKNSHPHAIIAIIIDANKANNLTHSIMFHQNLYHVHFQKVGDFHSQLRSWRFCLKIKSLSGGLWLAGDISTMVIPCNSTCLLVKSVKSMWNPLKYVFLDTNNTLRIVKSYWISNVQDIHFKLYNSGRYLIVCFFYTGPSSLYLVPIWPLRNGTLPWWRLWPQRGGWSWSSSSDPVFLVVARGSMDWNQLKSIQMIWHQNYSTIP